MLTAKIAGISHAYELTGGLAASEGANANHLPGKDTASKNKAADGESETLVFIHGWLLSQAYWQPLVQNLAECYRCLTYDLRGFGASTAAPEAFDQTPRTIELPPGKLLPGADTTQQDSFTASPYSLAAYAQDLEALLDELGIETAWLLGHSLGGSVALWAAYLLPRRIKGVICINAGGGIYIPNEFEKFRSAGQQMVKFRPAWLTQMPLLPQLFSRLMVKQPLDTRWGQQRIQDFVRADKQAALGSLLETTTEEEVHLLPQVVRQLEQPVHFITATQDNIMPPRYVHYLASFHPHFKAAAQDISQKTDQGLASSVSAGSTISEIDNCGHMAMVEQPQAVAEVIRSVVTRSVASQDLS